MNAMVHVEILSVRQNINFTVTVRDSFSKLKLTCRSMLKYKKKCFIFYGKTGKTQFSLGKLFWVYSTMLLAIIAFPRPRDFVFLDMCTVIVRSQGINGYLCTQYILEIENMSRGIFCFGPVTIVRGH